MPMDSLKPGEAGAPSGPQGAEGTGGSGGTGKPTDPDSLRPFLAALALCAFGAIAVGLSPLFVRAADVGPQASAFWRAALALPLALLWAGIEHRGRRRAERAGASGSARREAARSTSGRFGLGASGLALAALGGLFFAGDLAFWHIAILGTTLANATFLTNSAPVVLVALGAWIVFRAAPTRRFVLATVAAALGAALLLGESARFDPANLSGDMAAFVTAGFFSAYLLAMSAAGRQARPGAAMLTAAGATTLGLAFSFLISGEEVFFPQSAEGWRTVLMLGVFCQGLGQGAIMTSVRVLPAGLAALIVLLEPLTTVALGWALLGEALSPREIAGGALALAAIVIGAERVRRP